MIAYKFLRPDGTSPFTGFAWPLPDGGLGEWVEAAPDPCRGGIHACRPSDLPLWIGRVLYEIELEGEIVPEPTKVVGARGHELAHGGSSPLADWEAVVEPSLPEGPALLGFVAARIAEEVSGSDGYRAERRRQTDWLVERLGL